MDRHVARIEVAPEFLAKALHLPEGTEIVASMVDRRSHGHVVVLGLEHPDLPTVDEGVEAPTVWPLITYHRESWSFDWNLPQPQDEAELPHPEELADEEVLVDE